MKAFKIIISALIAVSLVFSFASCQKDDTEAPKGMKLIESEYVDYKLYVPDAWTIDTTSGFISAYIPEDKSNISMLTMTGTRAYESFNDYIDEYKAELEKTYVGYEFIENESIIPSAEMPDTGIALGEKTAARLVYKIAIGSDVYKYMQIITTSGYYIYTLTYTALESNFDAHIEDVNKIISEFKF